MERGPETLQGHHLAPSGDSCCNNSPEGSDGTLVIHQGWGPGPGRWALLQAGFLQISNLSQPMVSEVRGVVALCWGAGIRGCFMA